jgi:hypothetical protein
MRLRWASLGIGILLASCGGGDDASGDDAGADGPPGGVGEPAALMGITLAHNQVRAGVSTSDPLPPLEWDPALAATAAAWVAMCRDQQGPMGLIDHNPNASMGHPYYVGENVYGTSGAARPDTAQQAVTSWASESTSYNYANNTCSGVCGHYTQIVWRASRKLGCAIGDCPSLTYRTSLVCNYGPGGNVNGQRPY